MPVSNGFYLSSVQAHRHAQRQHADFKFQKAQASKAQASDVFNVVLREPEPPGMALPAIKPGNLLITALLLSSCALPSAASQAAQPHDAALEGISSCTAGHIVPSLPLRLTQISCPSVQSTEVQQRPNFNSYYPGAISDACFLNAGYLSPKAFQARYKYGEAKIDQGFQGEILPSKKKPNMLVKHVQRDSYSFSVIGERYLREIEIGLMLGKSRDVAKYFVPVRDFTMIEKAGQTHLYFSMPKMEGGMKPIIFNNGGDYLKTIQGAKNFVSMLKDASEAVDELHKRGVAHFDIHGANFVLKKENQRLRAKLCDFSCSLYIDDLDAPQVLPVKPGAAEHKHPDKAAGKPVKPRVVDAYAFRSMVLNEFLVKMEEAMPTAKSPQAVVLMFQKIRSLFESLDIDDRSYFSNVVNGFQTILGKK